MSEYRSYIKNHNIYNWMLQYDKGRKITFHSDYANTDYSLSADKIRGLYKSKYGHLPYIGILDPLWIISPKYVTEELIYIAEKNPR